MYNHVLYLSYWAANSIVLYLSGLFFSANVVLGNFRFNPIESSIYAGFWATVLFWSMWDYIHVRDIKFDKMSGKFLVFWAFNFISYWLVARFAHITGFGVSSFWWALLLGLFAYFAQRLMWIVVVGRKANASGGYALE